MLRPLLIRLSQEPRLRGVAGNHPIARKLARRFVAGETLAEAIDAVRTINTRGMTATLDHLGENVSTQEEAGSAAGDYSRLLQEVARAGVSCNASVKLTHMGLDLGTGIALQNTRRVLEVAQETDNFLRIDMEGSEYVDRALEVFYQLFETHKNVGAVIQSYLYRSEEDLERLVDIGARVRLVKGAYLEPSNVAYQDKADVDKNFVRLMQILLSRATYPAIATHDENMIAATLSYARENDIHCTRFEFQMLYGIRRDLQVRLVRDGYNMRIYVPYGTEWYPYLMRRMAERPANLMFVVGNIAREALPTGR